MNRPVDTKPHFLQHAPRGRVIQAYSRLDLIEHRDDQYTLQQSGQCLCHQSLARKMQSLQIPNTCAAISQIVKTNDTDQPSRTTFADHCHDHGPTLSVSCTHARDPPERFAFRQRMLP